MRLWLQGDPPHFVTPIGDSSLVSEGSGSPLSLGSGLCSVLRGDGVLGSGWSFVLDWGGHSPDTG